MLLEHTPPPPSHPVHKSLYRSVQVCTAPSPFQHRTTCVFLKREGHCPSRHHQRLLGVGCPMEHLVPGLAVSDVMGYLMNCGEVGWPWNYPRLWSSNGCGLGAWNDGWMGWEAAILKRVLTTGDHPGQVNEWVFVVKGDRAMLLTGHNDRFSVERCKI